MVFKNTASTIPYHLRPHKAIERNLFLALLKKLDRVTGIDINEYRYVGFGAPFLDDFKAIHSEFGIKAMHCIEMDKAAYSRQLFNNPYNFIKLYPEVSSTYLKSSFKHDLNQIIWWDFAMPEFLEDSLNDAFLTGQKIAELDVVKLTFNASILAFMYKLGDRSLRRHKGKDTQFVETVKFLKKSSMGIYLPDDILKYDLNDDFSAVIRIMALRAIRRGISDTNSDLEFMHICSFDYADGSPMTTITGIVCSKNEKNRILKESGLKKWEFYQPDPDNEIIHAHNIVVPVMTALERTEIDRRIKRLKPNTIAKRLKFKYADDDDEHTSLIDGYCTYYRYLPYYSRIIY